MGLPMFKEPGESSPDNVLEKIDHTAASSRSRIRRERTVRDHEIRHRSVERNENQLAEGSATDLLHRSRTRTPVRVRRANVPEQVVEESTPGEGQTRWSTMFHTVRYEDEDDFENARRRQAGEELLRDALQYQRPGQRMRLPRSPRTSALRFEVAPIPASSASSASPERSVEEQALLARPYMPSPPHSFSNNSATNLRLRGTAEPTPGFAPAQGVHRDNEDREPLTRGHAPRHFTPPGESSWIASYPSLRRVSRLSPRPETNLSRYGGLGDRRRSMSTSSSEAEQDTWETLLTTMEPDAQLPSTDSSFTSATASQSTRQSRRSSRTPTTSFTSATTTTTEPHPSIADGPTLPHLNTTPSIRDMAVEIRDPQYDALSHQSRASMRNILTIVQNSRRFRITANPNNAGTTELELRLRTGEDLLLRNHFNNLLSMDRRYTSSAEHTRHQLRNTQAIIEHPPRTRSHRPHGHTTSAMDAEVDLGSMQRLIERLARREDIPDEWWAAAGLARIVRENH